MKFKVGDIVKVIDYQTFIEEYQGWEVPDIKANGFYKVQKVGIYQSPEIIDTGDVNEFGMPVMSAEIKTYKFIRLKGVDYVSKYFELVERKEIILEPVNMSRERLLERIKLNFPFLVEDI